MSNKFIHFTEVSPLLGKPMNEFWLNPKYNTFKDRELIMLFNDVVLVAIPADGEESKNN